MLNYLLVSAVFLVAFIALQLAGYTILNRKKIFYQGLLGLAVSLFIYSLFYAFELISPTVQLMKLCASLQRIGIVSMPVFWVIMALEYTNKSRYINWKLYALLLVVPAAIVFTSFTDDYYHLFYRGYTMTTLYSLSIADIKPGLFYLIMTVFTNVMLLLGNILYVRFYFRNEIYKKRSFILMATSFLPWLGYLVYMSGVLPHKIDINPLFLAVACLIYSIALSRNDIFNTAVIARHIVFDNINEIVIVLDSSNTIIDLNKKAEQFLGGTYTSLMGRSFAAVFPKAEELRQVLLADREQAFDFEIDMSGKQYFFKTEVSPLRHKAKVVILRDNTEGVRIIRDLHYYASMDLLTEVFNRNYFSQLARERIAFCARNNYAVSLIMMDLDRFKSINDTFGHSAGDVVLKKVADICKRHVAGHGFVGRYGGEEFVMLVENLPEEKVCEIVERIRLDIMESETVLRDQVVRITCSFGIYTAIRQTDLDELFKNADDALYKSKREGRNRITVKK